MDSDFDPEMLTIALSFKLRRIVRNVKTKLLANLRRFLKMQATGAELRVIRFIQ